MVRYHKNTASEKLSLQPAPRSLTEDTYFPTRYQPGDPLSTRRPTGRPIDPPPYPPPPLGEGEQLWKRSGAHHSVAGQAVS
ncbi:unnamed protein product [Gadus morhua 'NCC']